MTFCSSSIHGGFAQSGRTKRSNDELIFEYLFIFWLSFGALFLSAVVKHGITAKLRAQRHPLWAQGLLPRVTKVTPAEEAAQGRLAPTRLHPSASDISPSQGLQPNVTVVKENEVVLVWVDILLVFILPVCTSEKEGVLKSLIIFF